MMKRQILSYGCMLLAIALLGMSFTTSDLPLAELYKALALVLLLIGMKQLQQAGLMDNR